VPHTADHVTWGNWKLEVVDMDGKRIDKVLASAAHPLQSADTPTEEKKT